nr:MAG TPA: hypothetical protein [Caudoviricetes sp.]
MVNKAEELHAITLLQYDSFVEGTYNRCNPSFRRSGE